MSWEIDVDERCVVAEAFGNDPKACCYVFVFNWGNFYSFRSIHLPTESRSREVDAVVSYGEETNKSGVLRKGEMR